MSYHRKKQKVRNSHCHGNGGGNNRRDDQFRGRDNNNNNHHGSVSNQYGPSQNNHQYGDNQHYNNNRQQYDTARHHHNGGDPRRSRPEYGRDNQRHQQHRATDPIPRRRAEPPNNAAALTVPAAPTDSTASTLPVPVTVVDEEVEWCDRTNLKNWDQLDRDQKIRFLTPRMTNRPRKGSEFWEVDKSFYHALPAHNMQGIAHDDWVQRQAAAVEVAKREALRHMSKPEDSEADDDEDDDDFEDAYESMYDPAPACLMWGDIDEYAVKRFFDHLPKNVLFDYGFFVEGSLKFCFCPCSKVYSGQWLKLFDGCTHSMEMRVMGPTCRNGRFGARELRAHLVGKGGDPFHAGALAYIDALYSNFYNGKLDHEALHMLNTTEEQKIQKHKREKKDSLLEEKDDVISKLKNNQLRLVSTNKEQAEEIRRCHEAFDQLGLDGSEKPQQDLTVEEIAQAKRRYTSWMKKTIKMSTLGCGEETTHISSDDIEPNFDLSELFERWSTKSRDNKGDSSLLFCELDDAMFPLLLQRGKWNFKDHATKYDTKDQDKAVDEGGLTRAFLQGCWDQVLTLKVRLANGSVISLFDEEDSTSNGVLSYHDCAIELKIKNAVGSDKYSNEFQCAQEQVRKYFRALGRLMLHSLATEHVLPNNLMPSILLGYLFCDLRPRDEQYRKVELKQEFFGQLKEVGITNLVIKGGAEGEKNTPGSFLRSMDGTFIQARIGVLESMLEGLTLGGRIDFRDFFFGRRLQVMQEIIVASREVSAEMVIALLDGRVFANNTVDSDKNLNPVQKQFLKHTLPSILRKKEKQDERYLKRFLRHVTGLAFINREGTNIIIAFDSKPEDHWPAVHTCDQILSVPLNAYDNDEQRTADLLDKAMAFSGDDFGMA